MNMSQVVSISCRGPLPVLLSARPTSGKPSKRAKSFSRPFSTSFPSIVSPEPKSKSNAISSETPFVVNPTSKTDDDNLDFGLGNSNGTNSGSQCAKSTEYGIEKVIFDFRFLALLAVAGSLAGSLLCFLDGCVYIADAYKIYWTSCLKGVLSGKMVLRLVEAIDVYLAGTVMLIFGMGLYGLFISNAPDNIPPAEDRALKGSSLFGMFALRLGVFDAD
uniref:uncharacterized protein LOC122581742 isoform X2 n=1 Tax=Erigeron canadensis TaxID=72917 RepID=UPI001CB8F60E|nr:uncharacterized protein LOC122581742 isoform X2 [Erigeron canadensis]